MPPAAVQKKPSQKQQKKRKSNWKTTLARKMEAGKVRSSGSQTEPDTAHGSTQTDPQEFNSSQLREALFGPEPVHGLPSDPGWDSKRAGGCSRRPVERQSKAKAY